MTVSNSQRPFPFMVRITEKPCHKFFSVSFIFATNLFSVLRVKNHTENTIIAAREHHSHGDVRRDTILLYPSGYFSINFTMPDDAKINVTSVKSATVTVSARRSATIDPNIVVNDRFSL